MATAPWDPSGVEIRIIHGRVLCAPVSLSSYEYRAGGPTQNSASGQISVSEKAKKCMENEKVLRPRISAEKWGPTTVPELECLLGFTQRYLSL
eukprot:COSAG05_NODE_375_length_10634_cov_14.790603_5_plen_93_part_00